MSEETKKEPEVQEEAVDIPVTDGSEYFENWSYIAYQVGTVPWD